MKRAALIALKLLASLAVDYLVFRGIFALIDYNTDYSNPLRYFAPIDFLELAALGGGALFSFVTGILWAFGKAKKAFFVTAAFSLLHALNIGFAFISPCVVLRLPDKYASTVTRVYDVWKGTEDEEMAVFAWHDARSVFYEPNESVRIPFYKKWHGKRVEELGISVAVYSKVPASFTSVEEARNFEDAKRGLPEPNSCDIDIPREWLPFFRLYLTIGADGEVKAETVRRHFWSGEEAVKSLLTVPVKLSSCLFAFDILCFLSCFLHGGVFSQGRRLDKSILLSVLLILILAFVFGEWVAFLTVPVFFAIPIEAVAAIVFLVRGKKIHAASALILFVQHIVLLSLGLFVCDLYLD